MSNETQKYLVIGASGSVGSEVARLLRAQGAEVITTTSKSATSSNQRQVDLTTGEGIREAFEGVDKAFLLSPSGYADQFAVLSPLIQEAKRRGLQKVVLMSAMGAEANEQAPLRQAELALERSGLAYNIIRPNWFFQNFNTFWVHGIQAESKIALPAKDAKVSFIDTRDISAVAVRLLTRDDLNNQAFNLTGAEAYTHGEVAAALSKVTGKAIKYEAVAPETLRKGLLAAGLNAAYTDFLILIFGFLAEGYNASVNQNVKNLIGRDPITLAQYASDFKSAWK